MPDSGAAGAVREQGGHEGKSRSRRQEHRQYCRWGAPRQGLRGFLCRDFEQEWNGCNGRPSAASQVSDDDVVL